MPFIYCLNNRKQQLFRNRVSDNLKLICIKCIIFFLITYWIFSGMCFLRNKKKYKSHLCCWKLYTFYLHSEVAFINNEILENTKRSSSLKLRGLLMCNLWSQKRGFVLGFYPKICIFLFTFNPVKSSFTLSSVSHSVPSFPLSSRVSQRSLNIGRGSSWLSSKCHSCWHWKNIASKPAALLFYHPGPQIFRNSTMKDIQLQIYA